MQQVQNLKWRLKKNKKQNYNKIKWILDCLLALGTNKDFVHATAKLCRWFTMP